MKHIKPETVSRIKDLVDESALKQSTYTDTHMFASEYEGRDLWEDVSSFRTLIIGNSDSIAIKVVDEVGETKIFHNIDLDQDAIPMIVQPNFGSSSPVETVAAVISGQKFGRPVVRALSEYEGLGLIEDLEATLFPRDINRLTP